MSRMTTCPMKSMRRWVPYMATLSDDSVLPVPSQCAKTPPPANRFVSPGVGTCWR